MEQTKQPESRKGFFRPALRLGRAETPFLRIGARTANIPHVAIWHRNCLPTNQRCSDMTTYDSNYAYTMATQLAQYDTQYSYTRLDRNKTNYTAQQTALNSLSSALSTFQTKLSSLNSVSGSILQNKATLSSEGYATADVTSKAQAGSYQFFVKQLASKDQVALQCLPASGSLQIGQPGNAEATGFTVDLADAAYHTDVTLDLSKLAADINA